MKENHKHKSINNLRFKINRDQDNFADYRKYLNK